MIIFSSGGRLLHPMAIEIVTVCNGLFTTRGDFIVSMYMCFPVNICGLCISLTAKL